MILFVDDSSSIRQTVARICTIARHAKLQVCSNSDADIESHDSLKQQGEEAGANG
jgi:hypothetical protein